MNLFHCAEAGSETVPAPACVQTPLGRVRLDAVLDGVNVAAEPPSETRRLPSGGWLASWRRPAFDLELLLCRPALSLQPDMHLTDSWAALWRLRARTTIDSCTFTALWEEDSTWTRGGPDGGEGLDAKAWDDGQMEVLIVTQDPDILAWRSTQSATPPPEWGPYFQPGVTDFDPVSLERVHYEIGNRGLPVPLPPLAVGQRCQIQFAVVWFSQDQSGHITCYDLEFEATKILSGAGCS